jgi:hypothetical protein
MIRGFLMPLNEIKAKSAGAIVRSLLRVSIVIVLIVFAFPRETLAGWGPPQLILEHQDEKGYEPELIDVSDEGNLLLGRSGIGELYIYQPGGNLVAHLVEPPKLLLQEARIPDGLVEGSRFLGRSGNVFVATYRGSWIMRTDGHIVRFVAPSGYKIVVNPDGSFVLYDEDVYGEQKYRFAHQRYYLYDADGNYLRMLNRPPNQLCVTNVLYDPSDLNSERHSEVIFPKKSYHIPYPLGDEIVILSGAAATDFGWISEGGRHGVGFVYAFDREGRLLARSADLDDALSPIRKRIVLEAKDPKGYCEIGLRQGGSSGLWDRQGNYYQGLTYGSKIWIYKMAWVNEPIPADAPKCEVVALDGFGLPLPDRKGPPGFALEWKPSPGAPGAPPAGEAPSLSFLYQEQDIWVENGLYPVYSFRDYQFSEYRRDKPGAVLCGVTLIRPEDKAVYTSNFAPKITLDLRDMGDCGCVNVKIESKRGKTAGDYVLTPCASRWCKGHFSEDKAADKRRVDFHVVDLGKDQIGVLTNRQDFTNDKGNYVVKLDPAKPDLIQPDISFATSWGFDPEELEVGHDSDYGNTTFIETGDDTKIFIPPYVMTHMWLTPKAWPSTEKASMLVYSRNWHEQDMDDTEHLTETAPGSGRFVNADGSVVYEIAHVIDDKLALVPRTSPTTIDQLYLYITDPKIGLNKTPQWLFENGEDTGEYWSLAEPTQDGHNYYGCGSKGFKPWAQVSEEIEKARFNVEVTGTNLPPNPALVISWDAPEGTRARSVVPLAAIGEGRFRTTIPLLCFSAEGCDIGGSWDKTMKLPTPKIPGVIVFRDNNVEFSIASAQ